MRNSTFRQRGSNWSTVKLDGELPFGTLPHSIGTLSHSKGRRSSFYTTNRFGGTEAAMTDHGAEKPERSMEMSLRCSQRGVAKVGGHFGGLGLRRMFSRAVVMVSGLLVFSISGMLLSAQNRGTADRGPTDRALEEIAREVRHELIMLPYYGVFDHLAFRVNGPVVELYGQVTRPTLKSAAENVVKRIDGVEKVVNKIEVLPVSPNDDRLRMDLYRTIYGHPALNRYALQAVPPIHIIVKNGNVTLEGVVATEMDKNIANIQANSVPGVFSVTNNLKVEQQKE
jgi:hyperosmotically inducible protein